MDNNSDSMKSYIKQMKKDVKETKNMTFNQDLNNHLGFFHCFSHINY